MAGGCFMINMLRNLFTRLSNTVIHLLRKVNIFQRLIMAFMLLVLLPIIFITMFTFSKYTNEIEKNMESFISLLVQNVNVQIQDKFSTIERLAVQFYADSDVINNLESSAALSWHTDEFVRNETFISQKLQEIAIHNEYIVSMQVVTPRKQYFMQDKYGYRSGGYIRDLDKFRDSEYYQAAIDQHGYPVWFDTSKTSDIFYKSQTAQFGMSNTMTMTQAIYNTETRKLLGVLVINLKIAYLTESLRSYAFYGSGNTFLFSKNDVIMGINSDLSAPNLSQLPSINQVLGRSQEGIYSGRLDHTNVFLVYKQVPYTDLSVVHIVDKDMLLKSAYRIRNLCLLLVGVLIFVSLLVLYWTTISISKPLHKLMKSMRTFTNDHFTISYSPSGRDEVTILGQQFVEMAANTQRLVDQIYVAEIKEKSLELSKSLAVLNALQMQINPHFLYNTLDIIRWEAMYAADGECTVSRMIDDFCRLMRMTIKTGEDMVSIHSELNHAETYVGVMNFRHRDQISLHVQMTFDTAAYQIPKFTLQPLIENAILHAFNEDVSQAAIRINGSLHGTDILIQVEDNGKGMDVATAENIRRTLISDGPSMKGIALDNVNQRLKLLFGEAYGLSICSRLSEGTTISIKLPGRTIDKDIQSA